LRSLTEAEEAEGGWVVAQGKEEAARGVEQAWRVLDMKPRLRRLIVLVMFVGWPNEYCSGGCDCSCGGVKLLVVVCKW